MPEGSLPDRDTFWPTFYYPDNDPNSAWNHRDEVLNGVIQDVIEIPVITTLKN